MTLYICKKGFMLDLVDDDGGFTEESMEVEEGSLWERSENPYRFVGADDTVRLNGLKEMKGTWMEITEETLAENFEPLA